jgi:uncharacterized protein
VQVHDPRATRSSHAVHLAIALDLGDDLSALVTYDDRLAQAATATANGVITIGPS